MNRLYACKQQRIQFFAKCYMLDLRWKKSKSEVAFACEIFSFCWTFPAWHASQ